MLAASGACSGETTSDKGTLASPDSGLVIPGTDDAAKPDVTAATDTGSVDAAPVVDATPIPDAADASVADAADANAADASATTKLPFATGLGTNGAVLADGQVDPHWTVKDSASNALTSYVKTDALGYPGYWMAPSTTSKFISPFTDTVDPTSSGTFTYTTTFSLRAGIDAGAVKLVVRYASDNGVTAVTLNGQNLSGVTAGSYSTYTTLTVNTGFTVGTNTVTLVVSNSGGPTGMRAELDLTAN